MTAYRLILFALCLALSGCTGGAALQLGRSDVDVSPTSIVIDKIWVGAQVTREVVIDNRGEEAVRIRNVRVEGNPAFSVAERGPSSIAAGGRGTVVVVTQPDSAGELRGQLIIELDRFDDAERRVSLLAHAGDIPVCDDRNPCTQDRFDVDTSECESFAAPGPCDDESLCTTDDECIEGQCVGQFVSCDDDVECTADACLPAEGCQHLPVASACEDGDPCTAEHCDLIAGCGRTVAVDGTACGNPDGCQQMYVCVSGACVAMPPPDGFPCDDEDLCTHGDVCLAGVCAGSSEPRPLQPDHTLGFFGQPGGLIVPMSASRVVYVDWPIPAANLVAPVLPTISVVDVTSSGLTLRSQTELSHEVDRIHRVDDNRLFVAARNRVLLLGVDDAGVSLITELDGQPPGWTETPAVHGIAVVGSYLFYCIESLIEMVDLAQVPPRNTGNGYADGWCDAIAGDEQSGLIVYSDHLGSLLRFPDAASGTFAGKLRASWSASPQKFHVVDGHLYVASRASVEAYDVDTFTLRQSFSRERNWDFAFEGDRLFALEDETSALRLHTFRLDEGILSGPIASAPTASAHPQSAMATLVAGGGLVAVQAPSGDVFVNAATNPVRVAEAPLHGGALSIRSAGSTAYVTDGYSARSIMLGDDGLRVVDFVGLGLPAEMLGGGSGFTALASPTDWNARDPATTHGSHGGIDFVRWNGSGLFRGTSAFQFSESWWRVDDELLTHATYGINGDQISVEVAWATQGLEDQPHYLDFTRHIPLNHQPGNRPDDLLLGTDDHSLDVAAAIHFPGEPPQVSVSFLGGGSATLNLAHLTQPFIHSIALRGRYLLVLTSDVEHSPYSANILQAFLVDDVNQVVAPVGSVGISHGSHILRFTGQAAMIATRTGLSVVSIAAGAPEVVDELVTGFPVLAAVPFVEKLLVASYNRVALLEPPCPAVP